MSTVLGKGIEVVNFEIVGNFDYCRREDKVLKLTPNNVNYRNSLFVTFKE